MGRDVPCPRCGYNLRDMEHSVCPECGDALELEKLIISAGTSGHPANLLHTAVTLMLAIIAPPGLVLAGVFAAALVAGDAPEVVGAWVGATVPLLPSVALIGWVVFRRRVMMAGLPVQLGLTVGAAMLTALSLGLLLVLGAGFWLALSTIALVMLSAAGLGVLATKRQRRVHRMAAGEGPERE